MSESSTPAIQEVEEVVIQRKNNKKPWWLEAFLKRTFFGSCPIHAIRRNEMNRYCISCNLAACQYCISSDCHRNHKIIKIYRHVYRDVVSLSAMEKLIDCSQIQPFKCNKRLVLSLNPLPHSGPQLKVGVCEICNRRLSEPELYNYCCISCKDTAFARKLNDSIPPFLKLQNRSNMKRKREPKTDKLKKKRKGKPCRAPFF